MRTTRDLAPNPKNPRKITDAKLGMLKRAMLEFGDLSGVVYNRKSKQLVGGHQRTKQFAGATVHIEKQYPKPTKTGTVAIGHIEFNGERFSYREVSWDKHREMAANLAANKGAGEWDIPELTNWMKELTSFDADDFDMSLTMFDEDELADFGVVEVEGYTRTGPTGTDEDEVPEKPASRTRPGYIYQLGDHRLMCGNSIDPGHVSTLLKGAKPDMVYTDPPYGIGYSGKGRKGAAKAGSFDPITGDDSVETAAAGLVMAQQLQIPLLVFWGANYYTNVLPARKSWIVWDKQTVGDTYSEAELAWTNQEGRIRKFTHQWHGMIKASERGERRVHPTQKPVALAEWAILEYPRTEVMTVLDLFGGSGSTLIACEKTGRRCYMMELDTHYCDVIVERWEKYTGQKAKLLNANKMPAVTKLRKKPAEQAKSRAASNA